MKEQLLLKRIGIYILYALVLFPIAYLIGISISWISNNYLFNILNWVNSFKPIWRLFVLAAVGGAAVTILAGIINMLFGILVLSFFKKMEINLFVIIWSGLIYVAAVVWSIVTLFRFWPGWNFWLITEFILMSLLILSANYPLISIIYSKREKDSIY